MPKRARRFSAVEKAMPDVFSDAARELMDRSRIARLATADGQGRPHVIPLCYARVGDVIVFVVDEKPKRPGKTLKRMRNIAENPTVALVVDVYDEDWRRLEYALVHGRAEVVENPEERRRALEALRDRYPQYRSMTLDAPHNEVVRITPARVHHWRFVG
jgi:PPOX class probable F420-dependent enzyme